MIPEHPVAGEEWTSPTDGGTMVWIPPTTLRFKVEKTRFGSSEERRHVVSGFWIDLVPVTCKEFHRFLSEQPEHAQTLKDGRVGATSSRPADYVTWHGAAAYARWAEKRLPRRTELDAALESGLFRIQESLYEEDGHISPLDGDAK